MNTYLRARSSSNEFIGEITLPDPWLRWVNAPGGGDGGALFLLINAGFRLVLVGAGLFALWKVIDAGFTFMTASGDPQQLAAGRDKLIWTLVGILIIFGAFALVAIIGLIFFGDAQIFINPDVGEAPPLDP